MPRREKLSPASHLNLDGPLIEGEQIKRFPATESMAENAIVKKIRFYLGAAECKITCP
jgi:hypothetical protein